MRRGAGRSRGSRRCGRALFAPSAESTGGQPGTEAAIPDAPVRGSTAGGDAAATPPECPLSHLAQYAPYAIKGSVADIAGVPLQVDELGIAHAPADMSIAAGGNLFGRHAEKSITVRTPGEAAGDDVATIDGASDSGRGEQVLVLVAEKEPGGICGGNRRVAGMQHGSHRLGEAGNALNKDPSKNVSYDTLKDIVAGAKG